MKRSLLLVLLFAALSSHGQPVDISVRVDASPREAMLRAGFGVHVQWHGEVAPQNVVLTVDAPADILQIHQWDARNDCAVDGRRIRCTLPLDATYEGGMYVETTPAAPGTYTLTAAVSSTTPDPDPSNDTASASVEVLGLPRLTVSAVSQDAERENAADPARPASLRGGVQNAGETATDVTMRVTLPGGGSFLGIDYYLGPEGECATTPAEIVCHWAVIPWTIAMQFRIDYLAPDRDEGGTFPVRMEVTAAEPDFEPAERTQLLQVPLRRRFNVTTAADDGSGSLRQAMADASASCATTPCLIAFRTTDTIRPASALPQLAGFVKIDGGDAWSTIDGSLMSDGGAIAGHVCELRVVHLRVRNFPGHAIETYDGDGCGYARTGVFIVDNELTGNLRGVVSKGSRVRIENNVIRNSRRAGIFVDGGSDVAITSNEIAGNGASGVFVNLSPSAPYYGLSPKATLAANVIRDNFEWGVCRTRNGWVEVTRNSIVGNRYLAIDVDLDFETPNHENNTSGVPNKPVLTSATYDPLRNVTILRGQLDRSSMEIYASTSLTLLGFPQAERLVATTHFLPDGASEVEIEGDLRGLWLTALTHRTTTPDWSWTQTDTSELSNAVQVN